MNNAENAANNNGYDYVDLGLPSGTLWATMNVGASSPLDYGLYFQWGDTQGYTKEQVGIGSGHRKYATDWGDYKLGTYQYFTKYTSPSDKLELVDDAAHVHMGGDWHIPSPMQFQELFDNTTTAWTTFGNVNGMTFTSKKDESKFIFIPAAGNAWGCSVDFSEEFGYLWSSMLSTYNANYGHNISFHSERFCLNDEAFRVCGMSIRGVIDKSNDNSKNNKHTTDMNLVEILKNAPIGTELWSYACGTCYLKEIVEYSDYPIVCKTPTKDGQFQSIAFTKEGKRDIIYPNGQCVLFPSKDNQDWGSFEAKKVKHFEPFQKVLHIDRNNYNKNVWKADLYSHYNKEEDRYYLASGFIARDSEVIPYKGNEDKLGKEVD